MQGRDGGGAAFLGTRVGGRQVRMVEVVRADGTFCLRIAFVFLVKQEWMVPWAVSAVTEPLGGWGQRTECKWVPGSRTEADFHGRQCRCVLWLAPLPQLQVLRVERGAGGEWHLGSGDIAN
jgi:hypothetical protein